MIKYPTPKTLHETKTTPVSSANRGMNWEADINQTNDYYRETNRAIIYKKPTPIHVVHIQNPSHADSYIDRAYFQQPSTTDYNGIYRGRYIDFEAKETKNKTSFPLANIHRHQIDHLMAIIKHGGIGFVLVFFSALNEAYLIDGQRMDLYYKDATKRSIPYSDIRQLGHRIPNGYVARVPYLDVVDTVYFNSPK